MLTVNGRPAKGMAGKLQAEGLAPSKRDALKVLARGRGAA
jgi:hypothetical protein